MALGLSFEDICQYIGIERRADGKLYDRDGYECNIQRALSSEVDCETRALRPSETLLDIPEEIGKRVRWV
jgi:hypothetical protein